MNSFVHVALPSRVVFGSGVLSTLGAEMEGLGVSRGFLLSTPGQRPALERLAAQLGDRVAGAFTGATMHTPVDVTEKAVAKALEVGADCTIALGGGSTIGLGKAIALRTDLPQIVIPTTYAGSEATPIIGQTEGGLKTTLRTLKVLPEVIIYDVDLTLDLPAALTAASGLNAIAHAAEGLYARDISPVNAMIAEDGVRALARSLPILADEPQDFRARSDALYGAWACGTILGAVGMSLHHKLCHILGGAFGLPHAETHAVILPHAVAYNAGGAPDAMRRLAAALNVEDAAAGLYQLARRLGAPLSLEALGMSADDIPRAVELALQDPYWNPVALERVGLTRLLRNAYDGLAPANAGL